jgi:hypothetical protein
VPEGQAQDGSEPTSGLRPDLGEQPTKPHGRGSWKRREFILAGVAATAAVSFGGAVVSHWSSLLGPQNPTEQQAPMNADDSAVATRLQDLFTSKSSGAYIRQNLTAIKATSTTLAVPANIGDLAISLTSTLKVGAYSIDSETVMIRDISGTGPFTATLSSALTAEHSPSAVVTTTHRDYELIYGIGGGRYIIHNYDWSFNPIYTNGLNRLRKCRVASPMLSASLPEAESSRTGSWSSPAPDVRCFSGYYRQSTKAGSTASFMTADLTTAVGWRGIQKSNGGLAKATVDGDSNKANRLPTAQQVVDHGLYSEAILIANGGELNPTDRVLDCFFKSSNYDAKILIGDSLTPGVHTVVLTATGYQPINEQAVGNRVYLSGFCYALDSTTIESADIDLVDSGSINNEATVSSAWEYADSERPVGSNNDPLFIGSVHGYEQLEDTRSCIVYLGNDAEPTVLTDGALTPAGNAGDIRIIRNSHLYHPDVSNGTTITKTAKTTYTLNHLGLKVDSIVTYHQDMDVKTAYVMLPVNGVLNAAGGFDRARLSNLRDSLTFTGLAGDNRYGFSKSGVVWMWQSAGQIGAMIYVPDIDGFTDNWSNNKATLSSVEDRAGGLTKVYISWIDVDNPFYRVHKGFIKERTQQYLMGYFPDGAESALASL